jgi:hypothetical protein
MIHHHGLTPLKFLQSGVFLLELLGSLLVGCAFLFKKAAQFLNFCFGAGWKEITEKLEIRLTEQRSEREGRGQLNSLGCWLLDRPRVDHLVCGALRH